MPDCHSAPLVSHLEQRWADSSMPLGADSQRLFHGRGGCYPGLEQVTLDWFAPVLLLTLFRSHDDSWEAALIGAVQAWQASLVTESQLAADKVQALLVQRRYLPGAPSQVVSGVLPDAVYAQRGSLRFQLALGQHQNTGFFLDMEPGRQWLERYAAGRKLLNLFAYTCAFSVIGQAAGASEVVNVDMSRAALSQGRDNHRLNEMATDPIYFLGENILKSWGRIRRRGPFGVAVIDPPSFQRGSFVAEKDYAKVLRRIPQFMEAGGDLLLCLNAPELDESFLQAHMQAECPDCQLIERLPEHPDFPDSSRDRGLKLLHYRYLP